MGSQRDYYEFMGYPTGELAKRYSRYADRLAGNGRVLDIGCGRGEFLELMAQRGVDALGIDLDEEMVAEAVATGHRAEVADAIAFLHGHPGEFGGIFCAHVIEHLPAESMVELVRAGAAALAPGGRLIAVTPNPHSLEVQLHEFWTDLQHVRFYTPDIMRWVLHDAGLRDVEADYNPDYRSGRNLRPGAPEWTAPPPPSALPARPVRPALGLKARLRQRLAELFQPASTLERLQALEDRFTALDTRIDALANAVEAVPPLVTRLSEHVQALFPPGEFYVTGVR